MSITRIIDERVLDPISEEKPAGVDLRGLKDWVEIRKARPNLNDVGDKRDWQPANPIQTDWSTYKDLVESALCNKSKDIELGIFLTDACTRLYGFAGIRDGIWAVRGLLVGFSDKGLYPLPEEDNLEARYGKLDWLNEKLAEATREVPITMRPVPGVNYSLNYRDEAMRPNGMITTAEFESAVSAGSREQYEVLNNEIEEARSEFEQFEQVVNEQFGPDALSFTSLKQALEECRTAISSILRKRSGATSDPTDVGHMNVFALTDSNLGSAGSFGESWADAVRMVRAGDIDRALSAMASLAAAEPNGRVRFQRKLLLAEICLQTGRRKLAKSILEELNELIEKHNLTAWETSDLIGAVWARLVRCYSEKNGDGSSSSEKAMEFFLKLSRLDPWQALAVSEFPEN